MYEYDCTECDYYIVSTRANARWHADQHHDTTGHTVAYAG
jgi:hypothetical protein